MITANEDQNPVKEKPRPWDQLRDPNRFRMCVLGLVLLAGYCLVYMPLSDQIQETTKNIEVTKKTLKLVRSIEHLREQYRRVEKRLPTQTDSKEWAAYLLDGMRQFHLNVLKLDCDPPRKVGPCHAVVLRIDIEGDFFEMNKLLQWLETDQRLFRVDSLRIVPARSEAQGLAIQFTILGLMG